MSKVIAIDAGHGINTAGKRCLKILDSAETREWYLNDRIADLVENMLKGYDCKVVRLDDTTGAKDVSLANRVKTANNAKADVIISIHHNAGVKGGAGGGTSVYCWPDNASRAKTQKLWQQLIKSTGLRGNRANPIGDGSNLYIIKKSKMTSLLIENGFMDSSTDVPIILSQDHAQKTANGIIEFLASEYGIKKSGVSASIQNTAYYPKCDKKYTTIYSALVSIGVNGSYSYRRKIARVNNIGGLNGVLYTGTTEQNTQMLNLLKAGLLKKV